MLKFMSKIGDAAYKTAAKTGIAAGSEMPPYPCAVPLQVVDDPSDVELVESILDATYAGVQDLMGDLRMLNACDPEGKERPWKALDYTDSDGDIKLMSRKHMGPYNFARATMTFERVLPPQILSSMHTQDLKKRKEYSGNITEYIVIARNPKMPPSLIGKDDDHLVELARDGIRDWHFEYNQYYAPPPVATRDFVYLVEKRYVAAEDAWYIYGTSIDVQTAQMKKLEMEKKSAKCVRGAVMFGWRLARVGADTKATYISCMNPNGWTPTFLLTWVQTEIAKEFQCARRLLYSTFHTRKDVVAAASSKRSYSQLRAPESSSTRIAENSKPVPVVSSSGDDVSTANDGDSRLTRSTMAISREDMAQDGFDAPRRLAHFDPVRIYPNLAADADVSKSCLSTTLSAELFERERVKAICAVAQWIAVQEPPVTAPAENVYRREAPRRCSVVSHGGLGSRTVSMESAVELCSCFSTFLEDGPITSPRVVEDRRTYAAEEELLLDSAVAL